MASHSKEPFCEKGRGLICKWRHDINFFELARGLVTNLFVLLGFVAVCTLVSSRAFRRKRKASAWLVGLLYGGMCVVVMLVPVVTHSGLMIDCRVGVIGTAAFLGGPVTGLASLVFPVAYRLSVDGGWLSLGILEIVFACAFGLLCHLWVRREQKSMSLRLTVICSLIAGLLTDLAMLCVFMPDILFQSLSEIGVAGIAMVILVAPVSMALLSTLVVLEKIHFEAMETLAETERRMLHSQKMAAIGQLSHKIAHSILNSLTVIAGNAEMMKSGKRDPAIIDECADGIVATVNSLSTLTGELVAFASPGMLRLKCMDLGKCLLGIENMLAKVIGQGIEVVVQGDLFAGEVMLDPNRIEQVIMHLAINAAEAMSGQGRLTISAAPAELSEQERLRLQAGVNEKKRHRGKFAVLTVKDSGCGMSPEVVNRIFEPFFTTKEDRDNAGLGLSTVYNIVQYHHGYIDVKSRLGQGTTFLIYFPIVS